MITRLVFLRGGESGCIWAAYEDANWFLLASSDIAWLLGAEGQWIQ